MTAPVPADGGAAASTNWAWSVEGVEVPSGSMERTLHDSGVIEVEGAGDVVVWLAEHGSFWGLLDTDQPFTLRVEPVQAEDPS